MLRALLSRFDRWDMQRVELPGAERPVSGYRLTVEGTVIIDGAHARAINEAMGER